MVIDDDRIIYNGWIYVKQTCEKKEMWGRREVAEYLGFFKPDGTPNTSNLYGKDEKWRWRFPDFGKALDAGNKRPYPKEDMIKWLGLPLRELKRRFRDDEPMGNYLFY